MNQRTKTALMWVLFAVLFLFVLLLQTLLFGRARFFGVKLNLIPVVIVCVTLWVNHEAGGLFGLLAGLCWFLAGADDGPLSIVTFTLCGILASWLCSYVFPRRFGSALLLCLGALLLHEGVLFLLKYYLEEAAFSMILWVPMTAGLSVLSCPVIYLLAKAIGKAGGN